MHLNHRNLFEKVDRFKIILLDIAMTISQR